MKTNKVWSSPLQGTGRELILRRMMKRQFSSPAPGTWTGLQEKSVSIQKVVRSPFKLRKIRMFRELERS